MSIPFPGSCVPNPGVTAERKGRFGGDTAIVVEQTPLCSRRMSHLLYRDQIKGSSNLTCMTAWRVHGAEPSSPVRCTGNSCMAGFGPRFVSGISFCSSLMRLLGFNYSYCLTSSPQCPQVCSSRGRVWLLWNWAWGLGAHPQRCCSPGTAPASGMPLPTQVTGFDFEHRWLEYLPSTHTSNTDCAGLPLDNSQIPGSRDCLITLLCLYWINIINVSPFGWATCYLSGAVLHLCSAVHIPRML